MKESIEAIRIKISSELVNRSELGQYFTPFDIGFFMSSLFDNRGPEVKLLDAGAGIGSLGLAFFENFSSEAIRPQKINVTAVEFDKTLIPILKENLTKWIRIKKIPTKIKTTIINDDFIYLTCCDERLNKQKFSHAIFNPPYKKINSESDHRYWLRMINQEHVNLYSAFIGCGLELLSDGGELVAIIPRSFCNGVYYKPFRKFILENACIKQIHLFESRTDAFKSDDVLQENIIIHLVKNINQSDVIISKSRTAEFNKIIHRSVSFGDIVHADDKEYFFHIPEKNEDDILKNFNTTLSELNIDVSTGPVVDFRAKKYIKHGPTSSTVPLLYSFHFNGTGITWPKNGKKPDYIEKSDETIKSLLPNECFVIVKRFSSKEEKQRVVARVLDHQSIPAKFIGIENHLNYFHSKKRGIDNFLAYGLAVYLNTSYVDKYFRTFNGHTQVNATDLRNLKYPTLKELIALGKAAQNIKKFDSMSVDHLLNKFL